MKCVCINRVHSISRDLVAIVIFLLSIFLCSSCSDTGSLATRSSGKPYEVVLLGNDTVATHLVRECLEKPVEGLPQVEPSFDVLVEDPNPSRAGGESRDENQYSDFRSIVKVVLTGNETAPVAMRYERDTNAQPQIIVTLTAGSASQLLRERHRWEQSLIQLLTHFEMGAARALLRQHNNKQATDSLKKLFGVNVLVPADMLSARYEKDFVWLSNNAPTGMQNICVMEGSNIDFMLAQYIKGETDSMYMKLVESRECRVESRGLWEMKGDAMGGPYVAHVIKDSLTGRTVTVLAFVYAPETKKRNMIRKLEAAMPK